MPEKVILSRRKLNVLSLGQCPVNKEHSDFIDALKDRLGVQTAHELAVAYVKYPGSGQLSQHGNRFPVPMMYFLSGDVYDLRGAPAAVTKTVAAMAGLDAAIYFPKRDATKDSEADGMNNMNSEPVNPEQAGRELVEPHSTLTARLPATARPLYPQDAFYRSPFLRNNTRIAAALHYRGITNREALIDALQEKKMRKENAEAITDAFLRGIIFANGEFTAGFKLIASLCGMTDAHFGDGLEREPLGEAADMKKLSGFGIINHMNKRQKKDLTK